MQFRKIICVHFQILPGANGPPATENYCVHNGCNLELFVLDFASAANSDPCHVIPAGIPLITRVKRQRHMVIAVDVFSVLPPMQKGAIKQTTETLDPHRHPF